MDDCPPRPNAAEAAGCMHTVQSDGVSSTFGATLKRCALTDAQVSSFVFGDNGMGKGCIGLYGVVFWGLWAQEG